MSVAPQPPPEKSPGSSSSLEKLKARMFQGLEEHYPGEDFEIVARAYSDAVRLHDGQSRHSGDPAVIHPLRVACLAAELGLDSRSVVIALLHDTLEDTKVTREELERSYGEAAAVIDGLTKISRELGLSHEKRKTETYQKLLLSAVHDVRTLIVKVLDRLDNMRDLQYLDAGSRRRITRETLDLYFPVAARLGLTAIARELAEISFVQLYPNRHAWTVKRLARLREAQAPLAAEIRNTLGQALSREGISCQIAEQWAEPPDFLFTIGEFYDAVKAIRVLVGTRLQVYAALGIIHGSYKAVPRETHDFISNPKANGYRAVITSVNVKGKIFPFEITTTELQLTNERGILARWHEDKGRLSEFYLRYLGLLESLTEDKDLRIDEVLSSALPDTITVFTPKGDTFTFPLGATCLDFAYKIHSTRVGDRCAGAKIRGAPVPIHTRLADGDLVEIVTADHARPSEKWIDWVVTARAKFGIRRAVKYQQREGALEVGRKLFELELNRCELDPEAFFGEPKLLEAIDALGMDVDEFLRQVGFRKIAPRDFLASQGLIPAKVLERLKQRETSVLRRLLRRKRAIEPELKIRDVDDPFLRIAKCCSPVFGDEIVGFLTSGHGVSVHLKTCPNVARQDSSSRILIGWELDRTPTKVELNVAVEDSVGMLSKITAIIGTAGVNISDLDLHREGKEAQLRFTLEMEEMKALRKVVDHLRGLKGVNKVWENL